MIECPICKHKKAVSFFLHEPVPIFNNILCFTKKDAQSVPTGTLDLYGCTFCGFVWNRAFDQSLTQYSINYENNQSLSPAFKRHLMNIIQNIESKMLPDPFSAIEIGCGQGYFLEYLSEYLKQNLTYAVGFDPALRQQREDKNLLLISGYADANLLPRKIDSNLLLIARHVIEHIKDPFVFMQSILNEVAPQTSTIALETPSLEWIIENKSYYDLNYEHCSLFTTSALSILFSKLGYKEIDISFYFKEQYLLGIASKKMNGEQYRSPNQDLFSIEFFGEFRENYEKFLTSWKNTFIQWKKENQTVALWGGSTKGVIFANMLNLQDKIHSAIDINPQKQGTYMPLTAIPVVSPQDAFRSQINKIIVMNPNYISEIKETCADMGFYPEIKSIESPLL